MSTTRTPPDDATEVQDQYPLSPVGTEFTDRAVSGNDSEYQTVTPDSEDVDSASGSLVLPDDEFWLEDGNLILMTENVWFRVYKAPLMLNSPVLDDMLRLSLPPQPLEAHNIPEHIMDRRPCPCGHLSTFMKLQDSPEDLRHLLRVLFPVENPQIAPAAPTFGAISACIRLGLKYGIDVVVQRSIAYLKNYYAESGAYNLWTRLDPPAPRPPGFQDVHCIGVVNLARLTNTDVLLPAALMGCCMLEATDLVNGFVREDGTVETLSPDDLGRCFVGRANLMRANTLECLALFEQTLAEGCTRPDECAPVFLRLLDGLRTNKHIVCSLYWHLSVSSYIEEQDDDRRLCAPCFRMLAEREKQQHREIWNQLPELMGVAVEDWAVDPLPVAAEPEPEDET